jgi:hypothetical protein
VIGAASDTAARADPVFIDVGFYDVYNSVSVVTWHRLKIHRWWSGAVTEYPGTVLVTGGTGNVHRTYEHMLKPSLIDYAPILHALHPTPTQYTFMQSDISVFRIVFFKCGCLQERVPFYIMAGNYC